MDNCLICGRQFEYAHGNNKKFCAECAKKRIIKSHRKAQKKYRLNNPEYRKRQHQARDQRRLRRYHSDPKYRHHLIELQIKRHRKYRVQENIKKRMAYHKRMKNPAYRKYINKYQRERCRRKKLGLPTIGLYKDLKPRKK